MGVCYSAPKVIDSNDRRSFWAMLLHNGTWRHLRW